MSGTRYLPDFEEATEAQCGEHGTLKLRLEAHRASDRDELSSGSGQKRRSGMTRIGKP